MAQPWEARLAFVDDELTHAVIGASHRVYNKLGKGFLENVYAGALELECAKRGLHVNREVPIAVEYDGAVVGTYRVDLLIERRLIVEVKASAETNNPALKKQVFNYLRCSNLELALLIFFGGDSPAARRFTCRNVLKACQRSLELNTDSLSIGEAAPDSPSDFFAV